MNRLLEQYIVVPNTPKDVEKKGMIQELSSNIKISDTPGSEFQGTNWMQRTRPKKKLRMNMKAVLDSKF